MKQLYAGLFLVLMGVLGWRLLVPARAPGIVPVNESGKAAERMEEVLRSMDIAAGYTPTEVPPEIIERPLFFKGRQPPPPLDSSSQSSKSASPPKPSGPPPKVRLKGIVGIDGEKVALISEAGRKETRQVRVGAEINGWRLSAILDDKLIIARGPQTREVLLRAYKPFVSPTKPEGGVPKRAVADVGKRQVVGKGPSPHGKGKRAPARRRPVRKGVGQP